MPLGKYQDVVNYSFIYLFAEAVAPLRTHPAQPHQSSDTSSNTDTQSCHFILAAGPLLFTPPPAACHASLFVPSSIQKTSSNQRQTERTAGGGGMNITEPLSSTVARSTFTILKFNFVCLFRTFSSLWLCAFAPSLFTVIRLIFSGAGGGKNIANGSVIVFITPTGVWIAATGLIYPNRMKVSVGGLPRFSHVAASLLCLTAESLSAREPTCPPLPARPHKKKE